MTDQTRFSTSARTNAPRPLWQTGRCKAPWLGNDGGTMDIVLSNTEARVLGALVEKESTTPEYYPLSLNALVNACNQRSNRDPVMNLDDEEVRQALDSLNERGLAGARSGAESRVTKYEHRLAETFNFGRR